MFVQSVSTLTAIVHIAQHISVNCKFHDVNKRGSHVSERDRNDKCQVKTAFLFSFCLKVGEPADDDPQFGQQNSGASLTCLSPLKGDCGHALLYAILTNDLFNFLRLFLFFILL